MQMEPKFRKDKRKLIAIVGEGGRQTASVIERTLRCCGYEVLRLLDPQEKAATLPEKTPGVPGYVVACFSEKVKEEALQGLEPLILLLMGEALPPDGILAAFPCVVMEYGVQKSLPGGERRCFTFSLQNDEADYTAHDVRQFGEETIFEMLGAGVIGRIRLRLPKELTVRQLLAGAAAVLSAGAPFARVLECVNTLEPI